MKNRKKIFILTEVILAVLATIVAGMLIRVKTGKTLDEIAVIVPNSDDNRWSGFKYGLKMAAEDQDVDVFVVSTGDLMTAEEQKNLVDQELENGADAVVIQPVPGEETQGILRKIGKKAPVVLVETGAAQEEGQELFPVVEPDHYRMGEDLAKELLRDYNGKISGKTLGLVCEREDSQASIRRREGFLDALEGAGVELRWSLDIFGEENEEELLNAQTTVDIVAALDDPSLTLAGKCASLKNLHGSVVYGIGTSTESIYYLETHAVECLVVPDEFGVGYESLSKTAESLGHFLHKGSSQQVSHTVLRREQLFSRENQELLYTMSQ